MKDKILGILIKLSLWDFGDSMDIYNKNTDYLDDFEKVLNHQDCQDFASCDFQAGFFNITLQGTSENWQHVFGLDACSKKCGSNGSCVGFSYMDQGTNCQLFREIVRFDPGRGDIVSGLSQLSDIEVFYQDQAFVIPFDPKATHDSNPNKRLDSDPPQKQRSKEFEDFVQEPLNNKPISEIFGLPQRSVGRLRLTGYTKAIDLVRKFLELKNNSIDFMEWLKTTFRIPAKRTQSINDALERWCENYPRVCNLGYFEQIESMTIPPQLLKGDCLDLEHNMEMAQEIQDALCKCTPKPVGSDAVGFSRCSRRIPKHGRDNIAVCLFHELGMIFSDLTLSFRTIVKSDVLEKQFGVRLAKQCQKEFSQQFYVRFAPGSVRARNSGFKTLSGDINKFVICIQKICPSFRSILPIANLVQTRG